MPANYAEILKQYNGDGVAASREWQRQMDAEQASRNTSNPSPNLAGQDYVSSLFTNAWLGSGGASGAADPTMVGDKNIGDVRSHVAAGQGHQMPDYYDPMTKKMVTPPAMNPAQAAAAVAGYDYSHSGGAAANGGVVQYGLNHQPTGFSGANGMAAPQGGTPAAMPQAGGSLTLTPTGKGWTPGGGASAMPAAPTNVANTVPSSVREARAMPATGTPTAGAMPGVQPVQAVANRKAIIANAVGSPTYHVNPYTGQMVYGDPAADMPPGGTA